MVNATPKKIDNLDMSFSDKPVSPNAKPEDIKSEQQKKKEELEKAILGDKPFIFQHEGKKVYGKNTETGEMIFFDNKGEHVSIDTLDRLESSYGRYPDRLDSGAKKQGELKVRFVKEQFNEEKNGMETVECPYEESEFVSERQDYVDKDGKLVEAITNTIPKNHHALVKLLRDEIGQ